MELKDHSHIIVQFRDTPLDLSHHALLVARRTSFFVPEHTLVPLSVRREIGSPGSKKTIEKNSTGISVSTHVYIMNYIHGSMWNQPLGAWEDDAAIAGQLGEALSR